MLIRPLIIVTCIGILPTLEGCASRITVLEHNATGKLATCRASGTGIIGAVGVAEYMEKCKKVAMELGYTKVIADTE